ncbi:MAG: PQQ-binding-like beta-propeller repeat protein, partial [Lentisphaerae bacterium]|nr:PQQ-binding-like beta-propeller repeat protein [Lentisphaerota bacterium]
RGGRDDRRVLGNRRLVSAWCARGGPVLLDGILYFGAGIWPFMGTAIHAVDPASGRTIWTQGMLGELYVKQPHAGAESFGAVAPQGAFAAAGDRLVVPNGRSVPAVLRRLDGELMHFHLDGTTLHTVGGSIDRKIEGGSYVCTDGRFLINHRGVSTALYDVDSGNAYLAWPGRNHPVLADGVLYLGSTTVRALPLDGLALVPYEVSVTDKQTGEKRMVTRQRWDLPAAWELEVDASGALMRSGDRLYAAGKDRLTAIDLTRTPPAVVWSAPSPGSVVRLLAASGRLIAVTAEGPIHVFGEAAAAGVAGAPAAPVLAPAVVPVPVPAPSRAARHRLARLTDGLPLPEGWALVYDPPDAATLEALLSHPGLSLVAVVADPAQAAGLRAYFRARGIYGTRISVHAGTIAGYQAPPYVAQLVLVCQPAAAADPANLRQLFAAVRPYGGRLFLLGRAARLRRLMRPHSLPGSRWVDQSDGLLIERPGPLPGSAPWTHLYGSAANTAKSDESLVRAPLGLLWFGGNSHADVLPRHGHGPSEQVIRGRLFIQGIDSLSARDVYTGTTLWKRTFSNLGTEGIYYDSSYCEDPLDLTYNQRHIPGANARGTNFVATADRLYLLAGSDCLVLDPTDGRTLATFALPPAEPGGAAPAWGYIGVAGDVIIGGTGFSAFSQAHDIEKGGLMDDFDVSSSRGLAAFDRHSGALLWTRPARLGFRHNAVCLSDDTLYCIDALPSLVTERLKRRGLTPSAEPEILALDLRIGAERWRRREGVFGTWLGVAADRGVLLQGGRPSRDALKDEPADRLMALNCRTGEVLWDREGRYGGPCMLHGETIYSSATSTSGGAFSLRTGEPLTRPHPLTRLPVPWTYHRRYGCNAVVASEHLLTFRSGAAGYYDLTSDSGTANLGGFKSGCTSNLIAADGVLNAPDYTRTCTCSYQNQTSLALIHMPDLDIWTANDVPRGPGRILDLAVNLGAPGDRRDEQGNLWFDFPAVGGPSPNLPVTVTGAGCRWYACPTHTAAGPEAWIAASGLEGEATLAVDLITDDERYNVRRHAVAGPADDAEEAEGAVIQGSTDLEMVHDQKDQVVGLRFIKVDLRPEDPLADAFLCFTADEASTEVTEVVLRAQAAASAPGFTRDREDLSRRPLTTAEVRWIIPPWPSVGAAGP